MEFEDNDSIEIPGVATVKRSKLDDAKCRLAHVCGAVSPYADDEIRKYAENIINGKDGFCEDGTPVPPFAAIKEKITGGVTYADNMNNLLNAPSALCGESCVMACLAHLDEKGVLDRKMAHGFQQ